MTKKVPYIVTIYTTIAASRLTKNKFDFCRAESVNNGVLRSIMINASAKTKTVRPFNWVYRKMTDPKFVDWQKDHPLISIEIGCGAGLHPISWCKKNPNKGLIAIERTKTKSQGLFQRAQSHKLSNLYIVNADAFEWIPSHIGENQIDEYFFLYPNPYPKEKQANKRWYRSPFFHFALSTLKTNGLVHFATNMEWMFEEGLQYAKEQWPLDIVQKQTSLENKWVPRTHFERKYLACGQTLFDVTFCKNH